MTQSTAWANVEKGISNLKKADVLSCQAISNLSLSKLSELIHPCGYYNAKAIKLKAFVGWFRDRYSNSLENMRMSNSEGLRNELLGIHGVGEETADSILLYACEMPIFVIDAYTRRIVDRLGLKRKGNRYSDYQELFMENLPHEVQMFNEYHALLVALGKEICRKNNPLCRECCLNELCRLGKRLNK